jgi:excisionase family DNA binding protein
MSEEIKQQLDRIEQYSLLAAKNVLCFDDVALLTGLSKSHLYKLTYSHQIPHYKPKGKQLYFDRKEIEDWMRQNKVATNDEIEQKATSYLVTGKIGNK